VGGAGSGERGHRVRHASTRPPPPSPSSYVLSGSADKTIKIWRGGRCEKTVPAHEDAVRGLALLPGIGFVSVGNDGMLKVWSDDGSPLQTVVAHEEYIYRLIPQQP
jgi:WD40 repeat protein